MATIEERVSTLEKEMANLQGQLSSDMKHIDKRFDTIEQTFITLFGKLDTVNKNIAALNTTGHVNQQTSTTNEKLIWALGAFLAGTAAFVLGKIL